MDELQAGVEFALAVFPQSEIFLQPGNTALHHPAPGHDLEGVQFAAPGNLHGDLSTQDLSYAFGERLSNVATVA